MCTRTKGGADVMRYRPIRRNSEFGRVYARGKSYVNPALVLYVLKTRGRNTRVGLTANLAVTSGQLQTLMNKDIPQLTGKLNTIGDNFVLISNNLKEIDYATAMQSIDSTLANVKMLTDKLNRKDNTVGLLLNDPSLYNNLNATTANAASLLEDLKSHPKRYVHFSLFGKKDK